MTDTQLATWQAAAGTQVGAMLDDLAGQAYAAHSERLHGIATPPHAPRRDRV
jgi:hypothetical protein